MISKHQGKITEKLKSAETIQIKLFEGEDKQATAFPDMFNKMNQANDQRPKQPTTVQLSPTRGGTHCECGCTCVWLCVYVCAYMCGG